MNLEDYEFPMLKLRSKSVLFVFDFEGVVTAQSLAASKKGEGKAEKILVSQNFKSYAESINNVGIPCAVFVQGSAGIMKQIIEKVLRKARVLFLEVHYSSDAAAESKEVYRQFKQEKLEKLINDYDMIYYFDADATFITQLESKIEHREQFEFFKVA